jgi:hypothetical protein
MPNPQEGTSVLINGLEPQQTYFFRVTPVYRVTGASTEFSATTDLETYRLLTEQGDALKAETGEYLARAFYRLATEAGNLLSTEDSRNLEV